MFEFLRRFENCGIKIARVNSILIKKSNYFQLFTLILNGVGVRCGLVRFSLHIPFIEKSASVIINDIFLRLRDKMQKIIVWQKNLELYIWK